MISMEYEELNSAFSQLLRISQSLFADDSIFRKATQLLISSPDNTSHTRVTWSYKTKEREREREIVKL